MSFTRVLLPEPETPVTQVNRPTGRSTVTPLRLLPRAFTTRRWSLGQGVRCLGKAMRRLPPRYCPVKEAGVCRHLGGRALGDHVAAMHPGARAHVDHVVGGMDHVLVVLHHQHRVAEVAQVLERADEAVVVALVQADAGLVQHVHHAGQARADLAGQADALGLAAREGVGAAVQAQVVEPTSLRNFSRAEISCMIGGIEPSMIWPASSGQPMFTPNFDIPFLSMLGSCRTGIPSANDDRIDSSWHEAQADSKRNTAKDITNSGGIPCIDMARTAIEGMILLGESAYRDGSCDRRISARCRS